MADEIKVEPVIATVTTETTQTGADQEKGTQSNATSDEFLKTDPDKTGEVKKTVEELDKLSEINKKIQANFDREKAERLKIEAELKKEREKNLTDKQKEELRQQELEHTLKLKEQEIISKELQFNKSKMLHERGWDSDFMELISGGDLTSFQENCVKLQAKIDKFVEKKVNERLAKSNPVPGSNTQNMPSDIFSPEEIDKHRGDQAWFNTNHEKILRSLTYHKK
jgi:Domain of unknown function (DUF4355)